VVLHAHRARREQRLHRLDQGARREVLQGGYIPRLHCQECVQWPRQGQLSPPDRLQEGMYFLRVFDNRFQKVPNMPSEKLTGILIFNKDKRDLPGKISLEKAGIWKAS